MGIVNEVFDTDYDGNDTNYDTKTSNRYTEVYGGESD